ncbi:O-antigen ligase family protein [Erysipelothrix rhusiopathiae]|nr:O-antigen ligase family protein [Erysipelothrix rhusiopathiae]BBG56746.1 O-antigen ligase domain-containing protein [Erysipelothrix rhusiopathiae]BBG56755.1 O-antigen ligase domain-containing protein [Erysipelothrix rhusiopathiae]BCD71115.1 O-antigen ligase domain-containing protein [Erysipelothrix rhusiopathiae]
MNIIGTLNLILNFLDQKIFGFIKKETIRNLFGNPLFLTFIIISLFKPGSLLGLVLYKPYTWILLTNKTWQIAQAVSAAIIVIGFIKVGRFNKFNSVFSFMIFGLIISTILNDNSFTRIVMLVVTPIALVLLLDIMKHINALETFIKVVFYYHAALVILNLVLMITVRQGLYTDYRGRSDHWLFGNYQQNFNWFVIALSSGGILLNQKLENTKKQKGFRLFYSLTVVSMVISTLMVWSATTLASLFVIAFVLLLNYFRPSSKKIVNGLNALIASITATFAFAVLKIQYLFSFIIVKVLKKSLDFNDRSQMWDKAIFYFKKKPLFGYGFEDPKLTVEKLSKETPHNHYLNTLYVGGIAYMIGTIALTYVAFKEMARAKAPNVSIHASAVLSGYFVYFIAEAKTNIGVLVLLLGIAYYTIDIVLQMKIECE